MYITTGQVNRLMTWPEMSLMTPGRERCNIMHNNKQSAGTVREGKQISERWSRWNLRTKMQQDPNLDHSPLKSYGVPNLGRYLGFRKHNSFTDWVLSWDFLAFPRRFHRLSSTLKWIFFEIPFFLDSCQWALWSFPTWTSYILQSSFFKLLQSPNTMIDSSEVCKELPKQTWPDMLGDSPGAFNRSQNGIHSTCWKVWMPKWHDL